MFDLSFADNNTTKPRDAAAAEPFNHSLHGANALMPRKLLLYAQVAYVVGQFA